MGDVIRIRGPEIIAEVGGPVDESRVTLGIHGEDLDPNEISRVLGSPPTSAHRKGDAREAGVPPWPTGAWMLMVEGKAPQDPEELLHLLLGRISSEPAVWEHLRARFSIRIDFGIFISEWNRGFELSPTSMRLLHNVGAQVGFDIYANLGEDDG